MIIVVVFLGGLTTLGIELGASRLLAPSFGASNLVWATLIGLILVYLTVGYLLGGRLADRSPSASGFYRLAAWGGFTAGLIPFASASLLHSIEGWVDPIRSGLLLGSIVSVILLFSVPVTLLGCISPFAIRLEMRETRRAGRVSGRIYAISTFGSILGTFLPVLLMLPLLGTTRTFLTLSLGLLGAALAGWATVDRSGAMLHVWMPLVLLGLGWLSLWAPRFAAAG